MREFFQKMLNMPEDEFYRTVFPMVGVSHELSKVVCGGVSLLKQEEKERLVGKLVYLGAPKKMSNDDIRNACRYIAKRIFGTPRVR